jgi:hypothetical protein
MMGQQPRTESLFYYFRLQDQISGIPGSLSSGLLPVWVFH